MNTSKKILAIALGLPLFLGSAASIAAGPDSVTANTGAPKGFKALFKNVHLSETQKQKLQQIEQKNKQARKNARAQHKASMTAKQEIHKELQKLILAADFDEAKVKQLAEELVGDKVNRRVEDAKRKHEIFSVLTPEQKKQVEANMDNMTKKMRSHQQKRQQSTPAVND